MEHLSAQCGSQHVCHAQLHDRWINCTDSIIAAQADAQELAQDDAPPEDEHDPEQDATQAANVRGDTGSRSAKSTACMWFAPDWMGLCTFTETSLDANCMSIIAEQADAQDVEQADAAPADEQDPEQDAAQAAKLMADTRSSPTNSRTSVRLALGCCATNCMMPSIAAHEDVQDVAQADASPANEHDPEQEAAQAAKLRGSDARYSPGELLAG